MMQIEYPNTFVGNLKNGIQILKKKKDQGYFSDIILIGEDDFGIEQSFDFTSIIKNIEVAVRKMKMIDMMKMKLNGISLRK